MNKVTVSETSFSYRGDPMDARQFDEFVKRKVGSMCYVSKMTESIEGYVEIGIFRNEIIHDEGTDAIRTRIRGYDNVFKAYFVETDHGTEVVFPTKKIIERNFSNRIGEVTIGSEECVMRSMGSKLLRIASVRNQMNPLLDIINALAMSGELSMDDVLESTGDISKVRRYVGFLRDMEVVSFQEGVIQPGPEMDRWLSDDWKMDRAIDLLSSRMGRAEFMALHLDLNFKNILPYLRMSNVNCLNSLAEDKALQWSWAGYEENLSRMYREPSLGKVKILSYANNLADVRIFRVIKRESRYMFSCDPVLDDYKTAVRKAMPSISLA